MISKPTVLVLGAGASKPYGFPTGEELLREIVDIAKHGIPATPISQLLCNCGFLPNNIKDFLNELNRSGRKSVDAFLEHRPEFDRIGKSAMIAALIPKEDPATILDHSNNEHWYQYLFEKMGSSFEEICRSKLSIITFNYDRSLEYFLLNALKSSFNRDEDDCLSVLNNMPIVHVHGQLGSLNKKSDRWTDFLGKATSEIIQRCIPEIKIVHENVSETPEFIIARSLLQDAERICFLGFGYAEKNVQRLLGHDVQGLTYNMKQWWGTAHRFTLQEVKGIITPQMPQGFQAKPDCNNLDILRQTEVLF